MDIEKSNKISFSNHVKNVPTLYPDERLIATLKRSYIDIDCSNLRALDIGYGGGRNLKLLLEMGFNCFGIEYIKEAENQAKKSLNTKADMVRFYQGNFTKFNFGMTFDLIICWGIFCHVKKSEMLKNLKLIYNLLSDNGRLVLNFRTKNNWFRGKGEEIEDNTFMLNSEAKEYNGQLYSFIDELEISDLIDQTKFSIIQKERLDLWKNDASEQHSWVILELQK